MGPNSSARSSRYQIKGKHTNCPADCYKSFTVVCQAQSTIPSGHPILGSGEAKFGIRSLRAHDRGEGFDLAGDAASRHFRVKVGPLPEPSQKLIAAKIQSLSISSESNVVLVAAESQKRWAGGKQRSCSFGEPRRSYE